MKLLLRTNVLEDPPEIPETYTKITLADIKFGKNDKGLWGLYFSTTDNKYLDVEYTGTPFLDDTYKMYRLPSKETPTTPTNNETAYAYGVSIELRTEVEADEDGGAGYELLDKQRILLVPETREEEEEIDGDAVITAWKGEYTVLFIPKKYIMIGSFEEQEQ